MNIVIIMAIIVVVFFVIGFATTRSKSSGNGFIHLKRKALRGFATIGAIGSAVALYFRMGDIATFLENHMTDSMDPAYGVILAPVAILVIAILYGTLLAGVAKAGQAMKRSIIEDRRNRIR